MISRQTEINDEIKTQVIMADPVFILKETAGHPG